HDHLLAPPARRRRDDAAEHVLPIPARDESAAVDAADGADPAGKVALEERDIVAGEPAVADAVADGAPQGVGEVAELLGAQEGVVPALAPLDLREALAARPAASSDSSWKEPAVGSKAWFSVLRATCGVTL